MTQRSLLTLTVPFCLFSFSCTTSYRYIARENMAQLQGLTEKGDGVISGNFSQSLDNQLSGWDSYMNSYDLQGAYALTDQWSVLGSFSQGWASYQGVGNAFSPYDSCTLKYKNTSWTLGAQYMLHIHKGWYFAPSMGFGGSVFGVHDDEFTSASPVPDYYFLQSRLFQGYIQPAFYYKGRYIETGFGIRYSFNQFSHVNTNYTEQEGPVVSILGLQNTTLSTSQIFGLVRAYPGIKGIALEFQAGGAGIFGGPAGTYHYFGFNFSMGIAVSPYQLLKKKRFK